MRLVSCTLPNQMYSHIHTTSHRHQPTIISVMPMHQSNHIIHQHRCPPEQQRRRQLSPRNLSMLSASPRSISRITDSSLAHHKAVSPSTVLTWNAGSHGIQARRGRIRLLRCLEMAHSEQYGFVIGMGRYRPILPCLPCSAAPAQDRTGQANVS